VTLSFAVGPNAPSKTTDKVGGRLFPGKIGLILEGFKLDMLGD